MRQQRQSDLAQPSARSGAKILYGTEIQSSLMFALMLHYLCTYLRRESKSSPLLDSPPTSLETQHGAIRIALPCLSAELATLSFVQHGTCRLREISHDGDGEDRYLATTQRLSVARTLPPYSWQQKAEKTEIECPERRRRMSESALSVIESS